MSETLRVATYNVHGCVGIDRQRSEARIAEVIASMSADVVGLQELDTNRSRSARVDQAALIAQQLGWHFVFHPAMRQGDEQYGNAIISRFPLTFRRAIDLPGNGTWYCRETRIAIWVETVTPLGPVSVINTHFALGRAERFLQAQLLVKEMQTAEAAILLGDFNSLPGSPSLRLLRESLRDLRVELGVPRRHRTFPTRLPVIAVDHIFARGALRPLSVSAHRTALARVASDHFPLVAELTSAR